MHPSRSRPFSQRTREYHRAYRTHGKWLGGGTIFPIHHSGKTLKHTQTFALHDNHRHNNLQRSKKSYDLGMLGVLIHVLGDAANNIGVIISALVIWLTTYPARFYADPAVSMAIAIIILMSSIPLGSYHFPSQDFVCY